MEGVDWLYLKSRRRARRAARCSRGVLYLAWESDGGSGTVGLVVDWLVVESSSSEKKADVLWAATVDLGCLGGDEMLVGEEGGEGESDVERNALSLRLLGVREVGFVMVVAGGYGVFAGGYGVIGVLTGGWY